MTSSHGREVSWDNCLKTCRCTFWLETFPVIQFLPSTRRRLRNAIDALAEKHQAKLIILDNLSTLWRGDENEAQAWGPVQDWLIGVRSKGRSVLIVHHAGKSGGQRGTSRREDALDVVLALRRPESCGIGTAASFNVAFEKSRSAYGLDMQPFFASLDSSLKSGLEGWQRVAARVDSKLKQVVALHLRGSTIPRSPRSSASISRPWAEGLPPPRRRASSRRLTGSNTTHRKTRDASVTESQPVVI